jgi:hypothetical protein
MNGSYLTLTISFLRKFFTKVWILIQWGLWIRILNPNPDPGARKKGNEEIVNFLIPGQSVLDRFFTGRF